MLPPAADKRKHVVASFELVLIAGLAARFLFWFGLADSVIAAALVTVLIGAGKELLWDWLLGEGTPEWADFFADLVGAAAGCVVLGLLLLLVAR